MFFPVHPFYQQGLWVLLLRAFSENIFCPQGSQVLLLGCISSTYVLLTGGKGVTFSLTSCPAYLFSSIPQYLIFSILDYQTQPVRTDPRTCLPAQVVRATLARIVRIARSRHFEEPSLIRNGLKGPWSPSLHRLLKKAQQSEVATSQFVVRVYRWDGGRPPRI